MRTYYPPVLVIQTTPGTLPLCALCGIEFEKDRRVSPRRGVWHSFRHEARESRLPARNTGSAPMSRALCICRGANDARRRSLLRDAKPHNRWRPYAVAAGGVVEWKVRLARGLAAATWRKLNDRVLVVASTPFLTPRARVHV